MSRTLSHDLSEIVHGRSFLFVPGHRPERFPKAVKSGADVVILDLEDAVGQNLKEEARSHVREWLLAGGSGFVRINGVDSEWYEHDIASLGDFVNILILPKVSSPSHVDNLLNKGIQRVLPILETASGILHAPQICAARGVSRVIFGNADLAGELGIDLADRVALSFARFHVSLSSAAAAKTPPIDGATAAITDDDTLITDARHARSLGYTAKVCLHPRQVPIVNREFAASSEDLAWAREIIAAAEDGSVRMLKSQVIGKPVIDRALRMINKEN